MQQTCDVASALSPLHLPSQSFIRTSTLTLPCSDEELGVVDGQGCRIPLRRNEATRLCIWLQAIEDRYCIGTCIGNEQPPAIGTGSKRDREIASVLLVRQFRAEVENISLPAIQHGNLIGVRESNVQTLFIRTQQQRGWMRSRGIPPRWNSQLNHLPKLSRS